MRQFGDWEGSGLQVAVLQDWMCEPDVIAATGLSAPQHQQLTLDRFDAIAAAGTGRIPLMAVLQGWRAADYRRHLDAYGDRLGKGA